MKFSPAGLFGALFLVVAALPGEIHGDGMFIWHGDRDLQEPGQKAVIHWDKGQETMVLQVKFSGPAQDFAWIVPLPSRPEVDVLGEGHPLFEELSQYTQRRAYKKRRPSGSRGMDMAEAGLGVEVAEQKTVGVYDTAVLSGSDPKALESWLEKHGYKFPGHGRAVLEEYIAKKWWFCAMKINPEAEKKGLVSGLQEGELQPLKLKFASETMVYPLRISSLNPGSTEILLYLLSPQPMAFASGQGRKEGWGLPEFCPPSLQWDAQYGTMKAVGKRELPMVWEALKLGRHVRLSLSTQRAKLSGNEMESDLHYIPFDALAYWGGRQRWGSSDEQQAADCVLAWHFPRSLEKLGPELAALSLGPSAAEAEALKLAGSKELAVLQALAQNPYAPQKVLDLLLQEQSTSYAAGGNPSLSLETLKSMAASPEAGLRAAAARHPGLPQELLPLFAKDKDQYVRAAVAEACDDPALLRALASDPEANVRGQVARRKDCPADTLEKLSRDPDKNVRGWIAGNFSTPGSVLARLSRDSDETVRWMAAKNRHTPFCERAAAGGINSHEKGERVLDPTAKLEAIQCLFKDPDPSVRRRFLWRKDLPYGMVLALSKDPDPSVRAAVAQSPLAAAKLLETLAGDPEALVRDAALENSKAPLKLRLEAGKALSWERVAAAKDPKTRPEFLAQLIADPENEVRQAAIQNPKSPIEARLKASPLHVEDRVSAASGRGLSAEGIRLLVADPEARVRQALAENPSVPGSALEALARDPEIWVKSSMAARKDLTQASQVELAKDTSPSNQVRMALVQRKNLDPAAADLLRQGGDYGVLLEILARHPRPEMLEAYSRDLSPSARIIAAESALASPEMLERLSRDPEASVRISCASNKKTPPGILSALFKDPVEKVALFALANGGLPLEDVKAACESPSDDMRASAAFSPRLPGEILERLAKDPAMKVRRGVAVNESTPTPVLLALSDDKDTDIRMALLMFRKQVPKAVLVKMNQDQNEAVRSWARERLSQQNSLAKPKPGP